MYVCLRARAYYLTPRSMIYSLMSYENGRISFYLLKTVCDTRSISKLFSSKIRNSKRSPSMTYVSPATMQFSQGANTKRETSQECECLEI